MQKKKMDFSPHILKFFAISKSGVTVLYQGTAVRSN